jgi:hypothetical protein
LLIQCSDDQAEQLMFWQQAVALLQEMGLEDWLNGRSSQNPPYLPLIA